MAEFKRALGGGGDGGSDGGFGLDGATIAALSDLTSLYWPAMLGALVLMVLILRGEQQAVLPLAGGVMLLQAWQSGMFG
ncbi:MAG TPA: hypothetical protein VMM59_02625 [Thermohalobaculum sp.]|nr:hypothetical protein [Thermohalobaculum sp.]